MKEFRAMSKPLRPQVHCLPLLREYCHKIQLTLKSFCEDYVSISEVALSPDTQFPHLRSGDNSFFFTGVL